MASRFVALLLICTPVLHAQDAQQAHNDELAERSSTRLPGRITTDQAAEYINLSEQEQSEQRPIIGIASDDQLPAWLTPSLNWRLRYEYADSISNLDPSNGLTSRIRPGILFQATESLSAFVELEHTYALIDDYDTRPGDRKTFPDKEGNTAIPDANNFEINQLFLRHDSDYHQITVGRQRIIFDNGAHIHNAGWRQNEQTFDAVRLKLTPTEDLTLQYAYAMQVNRVFGNLHAPYPLSHFEGNVHLLNATYQLTENTQLGGYFYDLQFRGAPAVNNTHTFGYHLTHHTELASNPLLLRQENALQYGYRGGPETSTWYNHSTITYEPLPEHRFSLGWEHLSADTNNSFRAPLSTAHAYNGYADAFGGARSGGSANGLADIYARYTFPLPHKLTGELVYHHFRNAELASNYGHELDLVLRKKITNNLSILALAGFYKSNQQGPAPNDTLRTSISLTYRF